MHAIDNVPDECILHVFEYLYERETYTSCFTRRRWMINLWPFAKHKLCVNEQTDIEKSMKAITKQSKQHVKRLTLINTFEKFGLLEHIALVDCSVGDYVLELVAHFYGNKLRHLNLSGNKLITAQGLHTYLPLLFKLEHLDVSNCQKLNSGIVPLFDQLGQEFHFPPILRTIVLSHLPNVTFNIICELLTKCSQLEYAFALHLMLFNTFDRTQFEHMAAYSVRNTQEYLDNALIYGFDISLKAIYEIVNNNLHLDMKPSDHVIKECITAGHDRVIASLFEIGYPLDDIPIELISSSMLQGHSGVIAKLRSRGYSRFDEVPQHVMESIVERGLDNVIIELRGSRINKKKWELVSSDAIRKAFLLGKKKVIEQFRDMNLAEKLNAIPVDDVHQVILKGHVQVVKQLLTSGYDKVNDIQPDVIIKAIEHGHGAIVTMLRNAGYQYLDLLSTVRVPEKSEDELNVLKSDGEGSKSEDSDTETTKIKKKKKKKNKRKK
jgi:hypothetical protein